MDHLLTVFKQNTKRNLDRDEKLSAHVQLHSDPYFLRSLIETTSLDATLSTDEAVTLVRERIALDLGYPTIWISINAVQRATALALAMGETKLFSQASRGTMGVYLSSNAPTTAQNQTALRRLNKLGHADSYTGNWALDDAEFTKWILDTQLR